MMDSLKFELAADYLVMAATLAEIKSRLMLPKDSFDEDDEDPRAALIKRLQEYQRFKIVSEKIAVLPMVDRDIFIASAQKPKNKEEKKPDINLTSSELFETIKEILSRPNYKTNHLIDFEELSTQERIQILLKFLEKQNIVTFSKTLRKNEGKKGVVVTLLASLELAKDGYLELIQNKSDELFLKSRGI
jgi:segregation and condensation protein A